MVTDGVCFGVTRNTRRMDAGGGRFARNRRWGELGVVSVHVLELPYPSASGNRLVRHSGDKHYLTKEALAYRALVAIAMHDQGVHSLRLAGPLALEFAIAPPDRRARDADNLLKPVLDAITKAGVWIDDSNKVITKTTVEWCDREPGCRILLTILNNLK